MVGLRPYPDTTEKEGNRVRKTPAQVQDFSRDEIGENR